MKHRNVSFWVGLSLSAVLLAVILVGFFWSPYSTTEMDVAAVNQAPSAAHWMGTDNFGRDIFSRVMEGAGMSLLISVCVVAIGCVCGITIGALCGYFGGAADVILTRICDCLTAFPSVLLALVAITLVGSGTRQLIYVLGILFIPSFARVTRAEVARCRNENYIRSARLAGVRHGRILLCHVLPNAMPVLLPAIVIGFNNAILSEASMSFLGIGVRPPNPSLGLMLNDSRIYLATAPWYTLGVGLTMVLLILGFSLLSEGLRQRRS